MSKLQDLYFLLQKRLPPEDMVKDGWWRAVWQQGAEAFALLGLPTRKWENYRYTPIESRLAPALSIRHDNVTMDAPTLWASDLPGHHVVVSSKGIEVPKDLPLGVTITCITPSDILSQTIKEHVAQYAKPESDPFVALNTRTFDKVYYVHVSQGVDIAVPIYFHHVIDVAHQVVHPRFLLFFDARSRATIVDVVYQGSTPCFVNGVTERFLGLEACVTRALWQLIPTPNLYQFRYERNMLSSGAVLKDYTVSLGGGVVRNEQVVDLLECNSKAFFHGAYLTKEHDYIENQLRMIHHAAHTQSRTYYKSVGLGKGTGVFHGKIDVKKLAQKAHASQYHHGWSFDDARIYTRPELDICADDVVCKHGATLGKGIEEMLFYMRTRGLGVLPATRWLLKGFLKDAMDGWGHDVLCSFVCENIDSLLSSCLFSPSFVEAC